MMKKFTWLVPVGLMLLAACGGGKSGEQESTIAADTTMIQGADAITGWADADTTIYGRANGFGQSALTLITPSGQELDLRLTADSTEERYASIYGDREDTARYALTTRDNGDAVSVLINLSQLERFTTNYEIHNCHLVLIGDDGAKEIVEILQLDDHTFRAKGESGKSYHMTR